MHYFRGMAPNFLIDDPGFAARFKTQRGGVFAQDLEVLEAQQRSIAANPGMKLVPIISTTAGCARGASSTVFARKRIWRPYERHSSISRRV